MAFLVRAGCFLTLLGLIAAELSPNGKNVCKYQIDVFKTKTISTARCRYVQTTRKTCEDVFCWIKTSVPEIRKLSILVYTTHFFSEKKEILYCCDRWERLDPDAKECLKPTCFITCRNGYCLNSTQCICHKGYNGTNCETDIDECATIGCKCEEDVANCKNPRCVNTVGAFKCICPAGYRSEEPGICSDINECVDDNGGCEDECINKPGGKECACSGGREIAEDGRSCKSII